MVSSPSKKALDAVDKTSFSSCSAFMSHCYGITPAKDSSHFSTWKKTTTMENEVLIYGVSNEGVKHVGMIVKEDETFYFVHCPGAGRQAKQVTIADMKKYIYPKGYTMHTKS